MKSGSLGVYGFCKLNPEYSIILIDNILMLLR